MNEDKLNTSLIIFTKDTWLHIAKLWFVNGYSVLDISKELELQKDQVGEVVELLTEIKKLVKEGIVNSIFEVLKK